MNTSSLLQNSEYILIALILVLALSTMIITAVVASQIQSVRTLDPKIENAYHWSWATAVVNGLLLLIALVALGLMLYRQYGHKLKV